MINSKGDMEIILFGDFKYLFKIINCNNLGFDVYSSNDCYKDYYDMYSIDAKGYSLMKINRVSVI